MSSTLIIGIGTSGLNILEATQQFHYEFTGKTKPGDKVQYICFETDLNAIPSRVSSGDGDIEVTYLDLSDNTISLKNLRTRTGITSEWLPSPFAFNGEGAGGMSTYGRFSLWMNDNLRLFQDLIYRKYNEIGGDKDTNIYIVGSLTGGTGSGLCLDIPYLVRQITSNENVFGLFLIPSTKNLTENTKVKHENAFGALSSIDFFMKYELNSFNVTYPIFSLNTQGQKPYKLIQYISEDLNDSNGTLSSLGELINLAGMQMCLNIINTDQIDKNVFSDTVSARWIDSSGANKTLKDYYTSGFKIVQYPKRYLQEILAVNYSKDLLESLVDTELLLTVTPEGRTISKIDNLLIPEINNKIEESIENVFNRIKSKLFNYNDFINDLTTKQNDEIDRMFFNKFNLNKLNNVENSFYTTIFTNTEIIKDTFIDTINLICESNVNKHNNLPIIVHILERIDNSISQLLLHFKKYGLIGLNEDYETSLNKLLKIYINNINSYKLIGEKKKYIEYIFENLVKLAVMHTSIDVLNKIQSKLKISEPPFVSTTGKKLPTIKYVKDSIDQIKEVIGTNNQDSKDVSLNNRKGSILKLLTSKTKSFTYIYSKYSLEAELEFGDKIYQNSNQKLKLDQLFSDYNNNLWENIFSLEGKKNEMYQLVLANSVKQLINSKLYEDIDIYNVINEQKSKNSELKVLFDSKDESEIITALPPLVKIKRDDTFKFTRDQSTPLIIAANNAINLDKNIAINVDKTKSNVVELNELEDAIIFYQRYNYMGNDDISPLTFNPIKHIELMEEVKVYVKKAIAANPNFFKERVPYLTQEQYKQYYDIN
jgi:hypothetical protein